MSELWSKEFCPICNCANWFSVGDPNDGDPSKMDIESYNCWSCKSLIRLLAGEDHTDYKPHLTGTEEFDEESGGAERNGLEKPY
jgi:hypothetical protein